ncbi:adenylate kinase [Telmatocola sphagniphila]|jgi:adenylate kinase|uniref:Adenylate kinase n=1 Tax=Telmatocola sphagniphila TaxID=1123043 RepID=A0A8E6B2V2_9BACT|nr:adenylate kinase [Telmatocola sphagniphila]QVL30837.1 adenylate kinase [Telmatocola sphagniphila]
MRLVLVGPPGSGKGTQAELLTDRLKLRYIGTGDILRDAIRRGTDAGKLAEPFIKVGNLVPDAVVNDLVKELFESPDAPRDFVLDGYPRTRAQAIAFDALSKKHHVQLDAVLNFKIDDEEVVSRIGGRRICSNPACQAPYHITARPPRKPGICDRCGSPLTIRSDDKEETIRARLRVFHQNTDTLLEYYEKLGLLKNVPTTGEVEEIYADILKQLPKTSSS